MLKLLTYLLNKLNMWNANLRIRYAWCNKNLTYKWNIKLKIVPLRPSEQMPSFKPPSNLRPSAVHEIQAKVTYRG